jgi:hypothetical protein
LRYVFESSRASRSLHTPNAFYDPTLDRDSDAFTPEPDPANEVIDLLGRVLKSRI